MTRVAHAGSRSMARAARACSRRGTHGRADFINCRVQVQSSQSIGSPARKPASKRCQAVVSGSTSWVTSWPAASRSIQRSPQQHADGVVVPEAILRVDATLGRVGQQHARGEGVVRLLEHMEARQARMRRVQRLQRPAEKRVAGIGQRLRRRALHRRQRRGASAQEQQREQRGSEQIGQGSPMQGQAVRGHPHRRRLMARPGDCAPARRRWPLRPAGRRQRSAGPA